MRGGIYVLNFYSPVFVDQLKRGRKTATSVAKSSGSPSVFATARARRSSPR
jgi:hypothetical protein